MMVKRTEKYTACHAVTRRQFLGATFRASAGLAGVLSLHRPPYHSGPKVRDQCPYDRQLCPSIR